MRFMAHPQGRLRRRHPDQRMARLCRRAIGGGQLDFIERPQVIARLAGADQATELMLRTTMARGERIAAWLLVLTVLCMATARMF